MADNVQALDELARQLRTLQGGLTPNSLVCQNASSELAFLRNRVAELAAVTPLHRIARAVELAAMYGWGEVCSEDLLEG